MRMMMAAAAVVAALGAAPASAQAPATAAAPAADAAWFKICSRDEQAKKDLCLISQDLRTQSGAPLVSVAIRESPGEQRKALLASIPIGMVIKPGVQLQVDGGDATKVDFTICFQSECFAELPTDARFITRLKGGKVMTLTAYNQQGNPVRFDLTLSGFTAAYDGAGMSPQARQKVIADRQRRQVESQQSARDKLIAEQRRAVEDAARQ